VRAAACVAREAIRYQMFLLSAFEAAHDLVFGLACGGSGLPSSRCDTVAALALTLDSTGQCERGRDTTIAVAAAEALVAK